MFKYTPPWQVLCNSMEHDVKRLSVSAPEDPDVLTTEFRSHQLSEPEASQQSAQEATAPHASMESMPRRWVIQPLAPKLEQSDLRTMLSPAASDPLGPDRTWSYSKSDDDSPVFSFDSISISRVQPSVVFSPQQKEESGDVVVQAKQVTVSGEGYSPNEDWQPTSPLSPMSPTSPVSPTSSAGSHCGFYSFVDDPTSPEAELNEAWMVSPERKAKLATLKEEGAFTLQTYSRGRKPESLFTESSEESRYQVDDDDDEEDTQAVEHWEEERQLRKEIILSQAPKQNPTFKQQWSALESLDLSYSPNKLVDGFSICYKPSSTKSAAAAAVVEPGAIDDKQIDFSSAREQFLKMEKSRVGAPPHSTSSPKPERDVNSKDTLVPSTMTKSDSLEYLSKSPPPENEKAYTGRKVTVYRTEEKMTKTQSSAFDVLDSGLEDLLLDGSGGSGSDSVVSDENLAAERRDVQSTSGYGETPIEREIRISQEREESLRRSRGIAHSDVRGEMVEIKRTKQFSQSTPPPIPAKPKELKNRLSFVIQLEIKKDNKREEDVQNQSQVPGLYAQGTFQEVVGRKRIFELEDKSKTEEDKKTITDKTIAQRSGSGEKSESLSSPYGTPRNPEETDLIQKNSSSISTAPWDQEVQDSNKTLQSGVPEKVFEVKDDVTIMLQTPLVNVVDKATSEIINGSHSSEGTESIKTEGSVKKVASSSMSSSSSSPSSSVPTDSALQTPQPGDKAFPPWRMHLDSSGLQPRRSGQAPDMIQREIEQDLKREQELQEQRESRTRLSPLEGNLDSVGLDVTDASQQKRLQNSVEEEDSVFSESPTVPVVQTNKMAANQYYSPSTLVSKFDKSSMSPVSPSFRPSGRLPCLSMVTAQPWASPRPTSPVVSRTISQGAETTAQPWASPRPTSPLVSRTISQGLETTAQPWASPRPTSPVVSRTVSQGTETSGTPTQKGLTETLLEDFEERRVRLKREENSYAGIQPIDDVNNEVLEATRVTRRKSRYALRWEAGIFNTEAAASTLGS